MERRKLTIAQSFKGKTLPPVSGYLSTGCTLLDLAIADRFPGGFGVGRISHIFGQESATKTVLVGEPLGDCQRQGGKAVFEDVEQTFDFDRAKLLGIDINKNWEYNIPETIEILFV